MFIIFFQILIMNTVGERNKLMPCASKVTIKIAAKLGAVPWSIQLPKSISSSVSYLAIQSIPFKILRF